MKMGLIEKFRKQHILIQILDISFVAVLIYEIMTMKFHSITIAMLFLMFLIPFCQEFFKKEES